jgi:hypothetical protein
VTYPVRVRVKVTITMIDGLVESEGGGGILGTVLKSLESILSQVTQVAW